eukprot:4907793-Pyramimonas_sp.AAC.1
MSACQLRWHERSPEGQTSIQQGRPPHASNESLHLRRGLPGGVWRGSRDILPSPPPAAQLPRVPPRLPRQIPLEKAMHPRSQRSSRNHGPLQAAGSPLPRSRSPVPKQL